MAEYIELEDASGHILLEDGSGALLLEESTPDTGVVLAGTDWAVLVAV
jgi:3-oxoacyl-[acyl-carrier-protein] synthase III